MVLQGEAMKKILFMVGESGCGKTHLQTKLIFYGPNKYYQIKSTVSRDKREGETDAAYHFVGRGEFENKIMNDDLLQHVEYGGNYYGTTKVEYKKDQDIGIFICTPVGVPDTINALHAAGMAEGIEFEMLVFMTTHNLLKTHQIEDERIARGNIMQEFMDRYSNNEFDGVHKITFLQDEDVNATLHIKIERASWS